MLGIMAEDQGGFATAEALQLEAQAMLRDAAGSPSAPMTALSVTYHLGVVAFGRGDHPRAEALLHQAIRGGQEIGDPLVPAWSLNYLALLALKRRDRRRAAAREPLHGPAFPQVAPYRPAAASRRHAGRGVR